MFFDFFLIQHEDAVTQVNAADPDDLRGRYAFVADHADFLHAEYGKPEHQDHSSQENSDKQKNTQRMRVLSACNLGFCSDRFNRGSCLRVLPVGSCVLGPPNRRIPEIPDVFIYVFRPDCLQFRSVFRFIKRIAVHRSRTEPGVLLPVPDTLITVRG